MSTLVARTYIVLVGVHRDDKVVGRHTAMAYGKRDALGLVEDGLAT